MTARRWPVHPQPLPGESLASWFTRVARANASTAMSLLRAEVGRSAPHTPLDTQENEPLWAVLAERTRIVGGVEAVRALSLVDEIGAMGTFAADSWVLPVIPRAGRPPHRWCPTCLATDPDPYFRRSWRLAWVRWCPADGARLLDACPGCGARLSFLGLDWETSLRTCGRCRAALTPDAAANDDDRFGQSEVASALAHLADRGPSASERWAEVWCLQKWVLREGATGWATFRGVMPGAWPSEWPVDSAAQEALAFAAAWRLAEGDRAALAALARPRRRSFRYATRHRGPRSLTALLDDDSRPPPVTEARVREGVEAMLAEDADLSLTSLAARLRTSPERLRDDPALRAVAETGIAAAIVQRTEATRVKLREARARLDVRGVRASAAALQRESGVCRHTRREWEAQTGETFVESVADRHRAAVVAAIDVLQTQGDVVTLERVAQRAGTSRRTLASQPALRALLDKAHPGPSSTK